MTRMPVCGGINNQELKKILLITIIEKIMKYTMILRTLFVPILAGLFFTACKKGEDIVDLGDKGKTVIKILDGGGLIGKAMDVKSPFFTQNNFEDLQQNDKSVFLFNGINSENINVKDYIKTNINELV